MAEKSVDPAWQDRLSAGAKALGIALTAVESEYLLRFVALLTRWNKAYNLTAVRDPLDMIERHLIDSLSLLPYLQGNRILDMGTGPGLPGIPLAIMSPRRRFTLLDSNNKKIRFVRQAVLELGLNNVRPVHARVESLAAQEHFHCLVCRALTSLPRMLELAGGLMVPSAVLLAMKGEVPLAEISALPAGYSARVLHLTVPFAQAQRHLVVLNRTS